MEIFEIDIPTITKTIQLTKARIWVRQIALFTSAMIDVRLIDDNGAVWETKTFQMSGEEYTAWTDDQYLIDWVKNKL